MNTHENVVDLSPKRRSVCTGDTDCKGIVLAGGLGTRLYPITQAVNKQLLPVYDKPMIYYPLSVLMLAGIRDILLITSPEECGQFRKALKDGSQWGVNISYEVQPRPEGIAQAIQIGRRFIGSSMTALILGDNIFYGQGLIDKLKRALSRKTGATVFAYWVSEPERYGIVSFDDARQAVSIAEKPTHPQSNYAVTGLYFYDNSVIDIVSDLKPSKRGELEITDVNNQYILRDQLHVELLGRGYAWLDTGTHESLMEAASFIETIEKRQGQQIACLEEIAYTMGYLSRDDLARLAEPLKKSTYGEYLMQLAGNAPAMTPEPALRIHA